MSDNQKQSILLVGDDSANHIAIQTALAGLDVHVVVAHSLDTVTALVLEYDFALILFDVDTSDAAVFAMARSLDKNEKAWFVPVIFQATAADFSVLEEGGYAAGGVDFLIKPVNAAILKAKVKVFLELDTRQIFSK